MADADALHVPTVPSAPGSWTRLPNGAALSHADWERRHRRLATLLWAHAAVLPLLALLFGTGDAPAHLLAHAALPALAALLAVTPLGLSRRARTLAVAAGLLTCSATVVHLAPATTEAHFHFFVVMGLLCLYEDPALYGAALLYVLAHHLGLGLLAPGRVFAHGRDVVVWGAVHAVAILAASLVNVAVARLNQDLRERSARAERRLRRVLAVAAEGIVELDTTGRVRFANPAAGAILGCTPERLEGRAAHELFPDGAFGETFALRPDGGTIEVECAAGGDGGEDGSLIVTFHDITRRRRAERDAEVQYAATEALAASAGLDDGGPALLGVLGETLGWDVGVLWRVEHDGTLRRQALHLGHPGLAPQAERICAAVARRADGSLAGAALRLGRALWLDDLDGGEVAQGLGVAEGVALPLQADGTALGVLEFFSTLPRPVDGAERRLVAQVGAQLAGFMDRVRRAERATLLERAALADALTGLPNRRALDQRLPLAVDEAAQTGEPMCLALLDMDHFKAFNDTYGHPEGDALLREVASAWSREVRDGDVLGRYGGEEFALVLPRCTLADAELVAERVLAATPRGQTASVGLASSVGRADAAELLAAADEALYAAKRAGRARVHVAPERRFRRAARRDAAHAA